MKSISLDGKKDQLVGRVQERYGIARDQAERDVDTWLKDSASSYWSPAAARESGGPRQIYSAGRARSDVASAVRAEPLWG